MSSKRILTLLWIALTIIGIVILGVIANKYLLLSGSATYQTDFRGENNMISTLYPEERVSVIRKDEFNSNYKEIFSDPVYFNVRIPRVFDVVRVGITYRIGGDNIVKLGAKVGAADLAFDIKHLDLNIKWNKAINDNRVLFQQEERYDSVYDFEDDINNLDKNRIGYFGKENTMSLREVGNKDDLTELDYVLIDKNFVETDAGYQKAIVEFESNGLYINKDNRLEFIISAPMVNDDCENRLYIKNIEVEFISTKGLFDRIKN